MTTKLLVTIALTVTTLGIETRAKAAEAYFNQRDVVLDENGKVTKFITPKALSTLGRFQVRISRPKPEPAPAAPAAPEAAPVRTPTLSERVEARRLMQQANEAFFGGDLARTWELVTAAEGLDPGYYRIKTMKGSLLYKTGSTDLALEVWRESLEQNPDQPEIAQLLSRHAATPPPGVARQLPARPKVASGTDAKGAKKVERQ